MTTGIIGYFYKFFFASTAIFAFQNQTQTVLCTFLFVQTWRIQSLWFYLSLVLKLEDDSAGETKLFLWPNYCLFH